MQLLDSCSIESQKNRIRFAWKNNLHSSGAQFFRELARGLIAYNDEDARRLAGRRTAEIEALLGYRGRDEMIHRDELAFTARDSEPAESVPGEQT